MSARLRLRTLWRAGDLARPPVWWLTVPTLLLFTFFVLPPAQYRNTAPLFAARAAEGKKVPHVRDDIPVLVRGLEGASGSQPGGAPDDPAKALLIRQRVGMNIFARSGYLQAATAYEEYPSATHYRVTIDPAIGQCADLQQVPEDQADRAARAQHLAFAVVALEKFNRTALQRHGERLYGRLRAAVTGAYPDLSYGPAQIRLSTARQLAAGKDRQTVDRLMDECSALNLTARLLYVYLQQADGQCAQAEDTDCAATQAAARFNGHRRATHAAIDYAPLVAVMADMIE